MIVADYRQCTGACMFQNLNPGDVFQYTGQRACGYWLRIQDNGGPYNAVRVTDGMPAQFEPDDSCTRLKAEVRVTAGRDSGA